MHKQMGRATSSSNISYGPSRDSNDVGYQPTGYSHLFKASRQIDEKLLDDFVVFQIT